jgi:hydrogenase expression/formation protein HypD
LKYLDEYRDPVLAKKILDEIHQTVTQPWVLMEICGGQTHSIMKNGIDQLLPEKVELVHGPGCPVCVTPLEMIDQAIAIARRENVIFTSFGDMLRVPGSEMSLLQVKAAGADVRMVFSPLEALKLARENPAKEVVFFAVGFETTAPGNAMVVHQARRENITNFSELVSHVLVPPAMEAILSAPTNRVQGFLAAGHVCAVMGYHEYLPIVNKYHIPIVPTGFEAVDLLDGILATLKQLEKGEYKLENKYGRLVTEAGNTGAQELIQTVYTVTDRKWRGIGTIPRSGYALRNAYADWDAGIKFAVSDIDTDEPAECISGLILQGIKKPPECTAFGTRCTMEHPLGATMVSSEGACAAYFTYRKNEFIKA